MRRWVGLILLSCALALGGCTLPALPSLDEMPAIPELPEMPDLGRLSDIPGLPRELAEIPGLLQELGLGDITNPEGAPGLDALPFLRTRPGVLVLRGPLERRLRVGDRLEGTDIVLRGVNQDGAVFEIAGMRSVRTYADSLDFDGGWPGLDGVEYYVRMRLYQIGRDSVRAVGVHQLEIPQVTPTPLGEDEQPVTARRIELRFPVTWGVSRGEIIPGTTLSYLGSHDRGAEIGPLGDNIYPYHKVGDSIRWRGRLRPGVDMDSHLRMLAYGEDSARVGGMVSIYLPGD